MTYQEIIEYYSNLLILQYHDKPKAKATIELLVSSLLAQNSETENLLALDVKEAFNLETATGVQLDIIGKYVGIDRFYQGQTFDDIFFGYSDENKDEPINVQGYSDHTDFFTKEGSFLASEDLISQNNQLNDDDYRFIIKLKIVQNNINHSNKSIDDSLFEFFSNELYMIDNYDMTITYFVPSILGALLTVILEKNVLPKPMAVGIKNIIENNTYFSFVDETLSYPDDAQGYSDHTDFFTKEGTFLDNNDIIV